MKMGFEKKLAIFLDNASIHHAAVTTKKARELDIVLIFNLPYCPQFMGIELFWNAIKFQYKRRVGSYRVNEKEFSNRDLVAELIGKADGNMARACAILGWNKLKNYGNAEKEKEIDVKINGLNLTMADCSAPDEDPDKNDEGN